MLNFFVQSLVHDGAGKVMGGDVGIFANLFQNEVQTALPSPAERVFPVAQPGLGNAVGNHDNAVFRLGGNLRNADGAVFPFGRGKFAAFDRERFEVANEHVRRVVHFDNAGFAAEFAVDN